MGIITEAGFAAFGIILVFVGGIVATLRARDPIRAATTAVAGIAGFAMLGVGLGQRLVDEFVRKVPELATKVEALSIGTREADANLQIGGVCSLTLIAFGLAVNATRKD